MIGKCQFSLGYLLLEVVWVGAAIGLTQSVYLTWNVMYPRPWIVTIPAAIVIVPTAIGGLFGQMRNGAMLGFAVIVLWILIQVSPTLWPFPSVH